MGSKNPMWGRTTSDKQKEIARRICSLRIGKKNPMWGKKPKNIIPPVPRGSTYEELYGKERAKRLKRLRSETRKRYYDRIGRKQYKRPRHEGTKYYKWRVAVYERDNYTCWICEEKGGKLNAHHLKGWAKFPGLRYIVSNGLTLCRYCHKIYTKRGAYKECMS